MNIVIPMAGRGQRFVDAGYQVPKLLIEAHGKTLLEWSVDSLPLGLATRMIFVGLKEHERAHGLAERIREWYRGIALEFVWLDEVTRGQAETVLMARPHIDPDRPLLIFNIDTAFHSASLERALLDPTNDGVLGAFESREPRFSFAAVDERGTVTRVTEKEAISEHALTGLYHYRRARDFLEVAERAIAKDERTKGEFYVAPMYNALIARGARLVVDRVDAHWILGTPDELAAFLARPSAEIARALPSQRGRVHR